MSYMVGFSLIMNIVFCFYSHFKFKVSRRNLFFMGFLCGFSCLFDTTNRIIDYNLFIYPRILQGLNDLLHKLNFMFEMPLGNEILFALSVASALYLYKHYNEYLGKGVKGLINTIFDEEQIPKKEIKRKESREEAIDPLILGEIGEIEGIE